MESAKGLCWCFGLNCDDRSPGPRQGKACFAHFLREHPECSENIREYSKEHSRTFSNILEHSRTFENILEHSRLRRSSKPPVPVASKTVSKTVFRRLRRSSTV